MDPYTYLKNLSARERGEYRFRYIACGSPFGVCNRGLALWVAFEMWTTAS